MPKNIKFLEPERCEYIYIDNKNKIHLMMPLVGGEEIGLDNTCKTAMEIRNFFFGREISAETSLLAYKQALEKDIQKIEAQQSNHPDTHQDLLLTKRQRFIQIQRYLELIDVIKKEYETRQGELYKLANKSIPKLPTATQELIKDSPNAGAIKLSPHDPDSYTRFDNPLFNLKRNRSRYEEEGYLQITEGLGARLYSAFKEKSETDTLINNKSAKQILIEKVIALWGEDTKLYSDEDKIREENFNGLKKIISEEMAQIDPNITLNETLWGEPLNLAYVENVLSLDEDTDLDEWISGIIDCSINEEFWAQQASSVFYDSSTNPINHTMMKVQFLLGEINFYCKTNSLSEENFGEFCDSEPHATNITQLVTDGLGHGNNIEKIIFDYLNEYNIELCLNEPLTTKQQEQITEKFTQHYNTIKESPHFDEFFIVNLEQKGNVYSHQGRISCHFLDFFKRHVKERHPLPEDLAHHIDDLQEGVSARLNHKNAIVVQEHVQIKQFEANIVRLLTESPEKLVSYLATQAPSGTSNYSMLTLDTQNYIAFNRHWPMIERQINTTADISITTKQNLLKLLSPEKVNSENRVAHWEQLSSKSPTEIQLDKIADALKQATEQYSEKRETSWWKGSRKKSRTTQCAALQQIAEEIKGIWSKDSVTSDEIINKLHQAITTLNRIDGEISKERNLFRSSLQAEIRAARTQLQELYNLKHELHLTPEIPIISASQLEKINDPVIKTIVEKLPIYCHTDNAINFFNTLSAKEATRVAHYIYLKPIEFNNTFNKDILLQAHETLKEVNITLLNNLKEQNVISEADHEKLIKLAEKIPPELFSENNLKTWSSHIELLEESKFSGLMIEVAEIMNLIGTENEPTLKKQLPYLQQLYSRLEENHEEKSQLPLEVQEKLNEFKNNLNKVIQNLSTHPTTTFKQRLREEEPIHENDQQLTNY